MDLNELMKNPEQIQQLITVLQALLPKEETSTKTTTKSNKTKKTSSIKTRKSKVDHSNDDTENAFLQMPERNMHKEDTKIDKLLSQTDPTPRSRKFVLIDVVCRSCGKKDKINPALTHDPSRYKCNNCSTSAS